jgi:hypothetical protein
MLLAREGSNEKKSLLKRPRSITSSEKNSSYIAKSIRGE